MGLLYRGGRSSRAVQVSRYTRLSLTDKRDRIGEGDGTKTSPLSGTVWGNTLHLPGAREELSRYSKHQIWGATRVLPRAVNIHVPRVELPGSSTTRRLLPMLLQGLWLVRIIFGTRVQTLTENCEGHYNPKKKRKEAHLGRRRRRSLDCW